MIVVGGVGQLYQGDLDFGRVAAERLQAEELGRDVLVEDFHYGAVAVSQRLQELSPDGLVLVGATARGRQPGAVERCRLDPADYASADVQVAVTDAVVGYVDIDLVVYVTAGFGVMPKRTVAIEFEPILSGPSVSMSAEADAALPTVLELVRTEIRRMPLFQLADDIRQRLTERQLEPGAPDTAQGALKALLAELETLEHEGRWGRTFAERDRLRLLIARGESSEAMDHLDWGQWWALLEELDRLEQAEALQN